MSDRRSIKHAALQVDDNFAAFIKAKEAWMTSILDRDEAIEAHTAAIAALESAKTAVA